MRPVIVIGGPTASGKSSLTDEIAVRLNTDVLSADAMQVYRGMDVGTAKTPVCERRVPLRLVDIVNVDEPYSAALFQRDAREHIERLSACGKAAVMCGGTGLYIRAAVDDMVFPSGVVDDELRVELQSFAEKHGANAIYQLLEQRDPRAAECIHPNNTRRVIRALEMHSQGLSYADQKNEYSRIGEYYPSLQFALTMSRDRLYERINARVDVMVDQGLVEEVEALVQKGYRDALTSMQAIGYKEIIGALEGEYSLEDAVDLVKQRSRRYAKRQLAWFRRDRRIIWIDMDRYTQKDAADFVLDQYNNSEMC